MWRLVLVLAVACGEPQKATRGEPQTAKEKQRREAKAAGQLDDGGKSWGKGWKYQGERDDCFFLVGKECRKTAKAACAVAKCTAPKKCVESGAGPTTISCK